MSVLDKLASALDRGDEAPNIALAQEIAAAQDTDAVRELVVHLTNADKAIASDCIKVLYEIGAQDAAYSARIFPFLLTFLRRCPPKDLPRHAESVIDAGATDAGKRDALLEVLEVLEARKAEGTLKAAQSKRIEAIIRRLTTTR